MDSIDAGAAASNIATSVDKESETSTVLGDQEILSFQPLVNSKRMRSRDDLSLFMDREFKPSFHRKDKDSLATSAPTSPRPHISKKHSRGRLSEALSPETPPFKKSFNCLDDAAGPPSAPLKEAKNGSPLESDMLMEGEHRTDFPASRNMSLCLDTSANVSGGKIGSGTPLADTPGTTGSKLLARISLHDQQAPASDFTGEEDSEDVAPPEQGLPFSFNLSDMIASSVKNITSEASAKAASRWSQGENVEEPASRFAKDRRVAFSTVTICSHERVLSDCGVPHSDDYPLGLGNVIADSGWEYPLDTYEDVVRIKIYGRRSLKHHPGKGMAVLKPLTVRQRRSKFRESGVDMLSDKSKECNEEVRAIQESREESVYCSCAGVCNDYCECVINGIGCYVEEFLDEKTGARVADGCGCMGGSCANHNGRDTFDGEATRLKIRSRVEELEVIRCSDNADT